MLQISDFGLSKVRGISSQSTDSGDGRSPAGTTAFIAPERYELEFDDSRDPQKACRADVYRYVVIVQLRDVFRVEIRPWPVMLSVLPSARPSVCLSIHIFDTWQCTYR